MRGAEVFFDLHDDYDVVDEDGTVLPDEQAARAFALKNAREIACESVRAGRLDLKHLIAVLSEHRRPLFTVPFSEAVEVSS
jgi:hypothetical protein